MEVIYEDNHIIAVDKTCREIVQGDKTGDKPLSEMLKAWLKKKYCKPGNVFVGVTHRLDRPVRRGRDFRQDEQGPLSLERDVSCR